MTMTASTPAAPAAPNAMSNKLGTRTYTCLPCWADRPADYMDRFGTYPVFAPAGEWCDICERDFDGDRPTDAPRLRAEAYAQHAAHRQYDGTWDTWVPVRVLRDVTMKAGDSFVAGDIVLCQPGWHSPEDGPYVGQRFRTLYSWRTAMNTSVPDDAILAD